MKWAFIKYPLVVRAWIRILNLWLRRKKGIIVARRNRDCHLCAYVSRQRRQFHPRELFTERRTPGSILSLLSLGDTMSFCFHWKLPRVSLKILIEAGETPTRIKRHYNGRVCVRAYVCTRRTPRPDWIVNYPTANYSWRAFALVG